MRLDVFRLFDLIRRRARKGGVAIGPVSEMRRGDVGGPVEVLGAVRGVVQRENSAMTTIRWFRSGNSPRGTPALGRALRRHPVVTLVLILATIGQTGCQSGPFGCGGCGSRVKNLSERAFRPFKNAIGGCKSCGASMGVAAAPGVSYGYAAPAVVSPTPSVVPSGPGTTTVVPNSIDSGAPALEAIPSERPPTATPGPAPAGAGAGSTSDATPPTQGARSSSGKASNYEALRPLSRDNATTSRAPAPKTLDATPVPTPRSAQGASTKGSSATDVLENLPPLNLSLDVPQPDQTPPAPQESAPVPARDGQPSASISPAPAAETLADLAARPASAEVSVAPGIRRFAGVESKLAGGSLPTTAGLDWLAEKGYRTILDLRENTDSHPDFLAEVTNRGMRYLALPLSLKTVDADHVSRFLFEVSLADARPLYFCDTDGTRAGALWYIRRVKVDKVGEIVARRDAEELGLSDSKFWLAANAYLASLKVSESSTEPKADPTPSIAPVPVRDVPASKPQTNSSASTFFTPLDSRDPSAWKSVAALVVTGLGVPLAYLSRSGVVSLARASLPAPRRSCKSLPGGSDGGT